MDANSNIRPFGPRPEEQRLVSLCLVQDRLAQKALYDRYKDAMFTLSLRVLNDEELAQDALQESFLAVFSSIDRFRGESTLGAWIKTIVVRTAYRKLRKEQHPTEELSHEKEGELIDWGDYLEAEYLEKAIASLPAGYRSVFVLIEVEGYAHKEVADMLGISVGTSKSQLYHAKRYLQRILTAMGLR
ncbi:MAG: RNA polymerase sigma factor [Bacteroidia bacterium]|jgi:RNA polymerase sigma factor (sigma-70 family)|nr:RNA polymerase sigma factor [Bacteroidia bacterium]